MIAVAVGGTLTATAPATATAGPSIVLRGENARGTLRCTALYPNIQPDLPPPGHEIEFAVFARNLSDRDQTIGSRGYLLIRRVGGPVVWSTQDGAGGGEPPERRIGPDRRRFIGDGVATRVRWSGPLEIRPVCPGTGVKMPWVTMDVPVATPPASDADAIASVAAFPGSPWADCVPSTSGTVTGELGPPDGAALPPLTVRCWADIRHEDGFDVVALSMVSPADAPDFTIPEPSDVDEAFFAGGDLPGEDPMLAMRWSLVVTADEVRPVLFQMRDRTIGSGDVPGYQLKGGNWTTYPRAACGFSSFGFVPDGRVLFLDWYTACEAAGTTSATRTRILRG